MVRRRSRRALLGITLVLIVTALVILIGATRSDGALADEAQPPEPTVVKEVVGKRTATSNTYLLDNGSYRCVMYESAINYKDSSGSWQPIDPTLVPASGSEAVTTAAAPVEVSRVKEVGEIGPQVGVDLRGASPAAGATRATHAASPH